MNKKTVFVAGPFTMHVKNNQFDKLLKKNIETIIEIIKGNGFDFFSAHIEEEWGKRKFKKTEIATRDIKHIQNCTHLIAYIPKFESIGTCIEVGYAIAKQKSILIFYNTIENRSDLLVGLTELNLIKLSKWPSQSKEIRKIIDQFLS